MAYNFPQNLVLIATRTASSSASLEFKSVISSNFSNYYISIRDLLPATNATQLRLTVSDDNGSTYKATNYAYQGTDINSTPARTSPGNDSATYMQLIDLVSSTSSRGISMDFQIFGLNQSSDYVQAIGWSCHYSSGANYAINRFVASYVGLVSVNALKFAMNSGNLASGSIFMYGVNY